MKESIKMIKSSDELYEEKGKETEIWVKIVEMYGIKKCIYFLASLKWLSFRKKHGKIVLSKQLFLIIFKKRIMVKDMWFTS